MLRMETVIGHARFDLESGRHQFLKNYIQLSPNQLEPLAALLSVCLWCWYQPGHHPQKISLQRRCHERSSHCASCSVYPIQPTNQPTRITSRHFRPQLEGRENSRIIPHHISTPPCPWTAIFFVFLPDSS